MDILDRSIKYRNFPEIAIRKIYEFLLPSKQLYLVDIGSVYGTFIRVKPDEPEQVKKG